MPSKISISIAGANAAANAIVPMMDGATMEFFSGTIPVSCSAPDASAALCAMPMSSPAFASAGASLPGRCYANSITPDASSQGGGVATHYRIKAVNQSVVMQGTIGTWAQDPDIVVSNATISTGNLTIVDSFWFEFLQKEPIGADPGDLTSYNGTVITDYDGLPLEEYS